MYPLKQSTAITVPFFLHDASGDAVTGKVDGDFTKRISKNGGAFAAMTVTVTEMENGWYSFSLSASHSDTLGILSITYTAAGAKQVNLQFRVDARLPDDMMFPTVSGRSTDVTATGEVGIDLDNTSGLLGAAQIDTGAITAAKIADNAITDAKLASGAITAAKIATDAIDNTKIAAGAITSSEAPNLDAAVSSRATPAQVNAEVLDVLTTDTFPEVGQESPSATQSILKMLQYLFKGWRNKTEQDSGEFRVFSDDGVTVDQKATASDSGTLATRGEMTTGP